MYPQRQLIRLNAYKAALLRDIASNRAQCVTAAARATQPLDLLDRILAVGRRLKPLTLFAAVPLGFILKRTALPRLKILGSLMRWGPLAYTALQSIRSSVKRHASRARPEKAV